MTVNNRLGAGRASAGRIAGRVGVSRYNAQLVASLRHPEWIYRAPRRVPRSQLSFREATAVTDGDVEVCRRLIAAYRTAAAENAPAGQTSEIWGGPEAERQRQLVSALEREDAAGLAVLLASMFKQQFVVGMATGNLVEDSDSWLGGRIWSLKILDALISLAEFLGVVRTENPEQGVIAHAFASEEREIVDSIEQRLGFSIDFPDVGAAYGISVGDRLIPLDSPDQLYATARLRDAIALHLDVPAPRVVEIGAGYGGMAYWTLRAIPGIASYTIIDLPKVNVLQGYFLSRALGASSVSFLGEERARVAVLPPSSTETLADPFDVLVNKDSMPEIPAEAVAAYLTWARSWCGGIFYSNNQEAYSPVAGVPQTLVPEEIARVGGFERLQRDQSWVRRGYVEEVYRPSP